MLHDLVRFQSLEFLGSWQKLLPLEISLFFLKVAKFVGKSLCWPTSLLKTAHLYSKRVRIFEGIR